MSFSPFGALATISLVALTSCSSPGGSTDGGTDGATDTGTECQAGGDEDLDLIGVWGALSWIRVELQTSDEGIVRMCPSPHPGITHLTLLITLTEQEEGRVDYDFVVCEIDMPRVRAAIVPCDMDEYLWVNLELGPELATYIPGQVFHGSAELGGTGPCSSYVSDMDITYGYDSSMVPATDPLPGWEMDCGTTVAAACVTDWETVIDEDGDGNPGVSLQVATEPIDTITGQAYTTWRTNPHMTGLAWSNVLIQGDLSPTMEYDVVGSGAELQGLHMDEKTVKRNLPVFLLPPSGSTFRMIRVDGLYGSEDLDTSGDGTVDCDELMARMDIFE